MDANKLSLYFLIVNCDERKIYNTISHFVGFTLILSEETILY